LSINLPSKSLNSYDPFVGFDINVKIIKSVYFSRFSSAKCNWNDVQRLNTSSLLLKNHPTPHHRRGNCSTALIKKQVYIGRQVNKKSRHNLPRRSNWREPLTYCHVDLLSIALESYKTHFARSSKCHCLYDFRAATTSNRDKKSVIIVIIYL